MSGTVDALSIIARLTNAALTLTTGVYVLYRYNRSRLRQSLCWGLALISIGISYSFAFGFQVGLIGMTVTAYSIEETFLSFAITLFYYACATTMTKSKIYTTFLTWIILVLQEAVIIYVYLILNEHFINILIHVTLFALPVAILGAVFFTLDYLSLRRRASLLIAFSFWFQLVLGSVFLFVDRTPLDWVYYAMNAADMVVGLEGFFLLAHSKNQQMGPELE